MLEKPLEQERNKKISTAMEEARFEVEYLFELTKETQQKVFTDFLNKLKVYEENGLVFNKKKIEEEINKSKNIQEKELFVSSLVKALEPLIILKVTKPDFFEKIELENRENVLNKDGNIKLSKILYAGLLNKSAHIHLSYAHDFMTKEKIADFDLEIKNGLKNLAKLIEPMKNIEKITATSWLVAKSPKRLEKLGFTIDGEILEKEKNKDFKNETKIIHKAHIDREKFDELYLDKINA